VRSLYESGVQFVAGSDAGYRFSKFGDTWHEAMTMHEVVMPIREALSAATDRAAKALGLANAGQLKTGYSADALVLRGNPVQDMRHLERCLAIYRLGHRVTS
jgi:imidazolonepropionase-like amidohydrolase